MFAERTSAVARSRSVSRAVVSAVASVSPSATVSPTVAVTSVTGHEPSPVGAESSSPTRYGIGAEDEAVRFRCGKRASGGHIVGDVADGRGGGEVLRAGGGIRAQPAERHGQRPDADADEHDQRDELELHVDPFPTSVACVRRRRGRRHLRSHGSRGL